MSTEEIKADINIRPEELEAIKKAQVIRLTDGTEYVRKDVAEKVMEEYAGKELASLKEENARLKFRADLMAIYKQEKEDRDKIFHQIKCTLYDRLTETEKLNDILKFFPMR